MSLFGFNKDLSVVACPCVTPRYFSTTLLSHFSFNGECVSIHSQHASCSCPSARWLSHIKQHCQKQQSYIGNTFSFNAHCRSCIHVCVRFVWQLSPRHLSMPQEKLSFHCLVLMPHLRLPQLLASEYSPQYYSGYSADIVSACPSTLYLSAPHPSHPWQLCMWLSDKQQQTKSCGLFYTYIIKITKKSKGIFIDGMCSSRNGWEKSLLREVCASVASVLSHCSRLSVQDKHKWVCKNDFTDTLSCCHL